VVESRREREREREREGERERGRERERDRIKGRGGLFTEQTEFPCYLVARTSKAEHVTEDALEP